MPISIEPEEIAEARKSLKEFERAPGISKKSCFKDGIIILNDFLIEHPNSEFSQRASNLKSIYTKRLIKRLGETSFKNLKDWVVTVAWAFEPSIRDEIKSLLTNDPELEKDWEEFLGNMPILGRYYPKLHTAMRR